MFISACALVFVYRHIRPKSSRVVGDESVTNSKSEGGRSGMAGRDGVATIRFYCCRPEGMVFRVRVGDSLFIDKRIGREASVAFIFPFLSPPTKLSSSWDKFLVCSRLDAVEGCSGCNSTRSQRLKSYR